ncbi:ComF family protein [Flavobacterium sp. H122]|uniref:ComF family protein n=1 Tax=Flavobacterium sp. H122 TaxID=2529860 RepID=UPI0010AA8DB9|nr:phosphoribosyltransferase family protein [Flavobacterium sp. H122]
MLKKLLNLFFPKVCEGCQNLLLERENIICLECRHNIPLTNHLNDSRNEAYKKFEGKIPIEHASAMMYYHKKGIGQHLIHNLKYKDKQEIGTVLGNWYSQDFSALEIIKTIDYIIPVPLHKKRLKERGYNQIDTFCQALSNELKIPLKNDILYRSEYAVTQSKKGLTERNKVSITTFDCHTNEDYSNKHFLLVDDVLTTGATLETCGKALLKFSGAKISIVTIGFSQS